MGYVNHEPSLWKGLPIEERIGKYTGLLIEGLTSYEPDLRALIEDHCDGDGSRRQELYQGLEYALSAGRRVICARRADLISRGRVDFYDEAKTLAERCGFSLQVLEDALSKGKQLAERENKPFTYIREI